jgi:NAD(P)-dependent dehydrogenase (short-subunit alcohol dehydrogenase family)
MAPSLTPDTNLSPTISGSYQSTANASVSSLFSLSKRTVIVTGAGRGLGIVLAEAILDAGGDVVCLDILPSPGKDEWTRIEQVQKTSGTYCSYYQCDITNEDAVTATLAVVATAASRRGNPIRGLISCAGVQQMLDAIDYPLDGFRRILEVNVTGSFSIAKHTARILRDEGNSGSIVFIASMSGQIANRVRDILPQSACTHNC